MKVIVALIFSLAFAQAQTKSPLSNICRTGLLRSYGLEGNFAPNKKNFLCPTLKKNCCSPHDQMVLHKLWNTELKQPLGRHFFLAKKTFLGLDSIIGQKSQLKLQQPLNFFKTEVKPHFRIRYRFEAVTRKLMRINQGTLTRAYEDLKKRNFMGVLFGHMYRARRSMICSICDLNKVPFISPDRFELTYSNGFCSSLVSKFHPGLKLFFGVIVRYFLLLDEYSLLASGKGLFDRASRAPMVRAVAAVRKCGKSGSGSCKYFCRMFKYNRLTTLFDGKFEFLNTFTENYDNQLSRLVKVENNFYRKLFNFRSLEAKKSTKSLQKFVGKKNHRAARNKFIKMLQISFRRSTRMIRVKSERSFGHGKRKVKLVKHMRRFLKRQEDRAYNIFARNQNPMQLRHFRVQYAEKGLDPL